MGSLQHSHNTCLCRLGSFCCCFLAPKVPLSCVRIGTPRCNTHLSAVPTNTVPPLVGLLTTTIKSCWKRNQRLQPLHGRIWGEVDELSNIITPLLTKMRRAWQCYGTTLPPRWDKTQYRAKRTWSWKGLNAAGLPPAFCTAGRASALDTRSSNSISKSLCPKAGLIRDYSSPFFTLASHTIVSNHLS